MSSLSTVLQQLISENSELNISELARLTGILQPVMYRLVVGETDNPKIQTIMPIAKHFNLTLDELMGLTPLPSADELKNRPKRYSAPLIEWTEISNWPKDTGNIRRQYVETDLPISNTSYAVKIKDPTMTPRFIEGTLLIIDPTKLPESGNFVIAELTENSTPIFKQVFFDGDDIYLKSLNSEFKSHCINKNEFHRFLGVAIEAKIRLITDISL